ncbi:MAG TPA: nucleotidyltransferase family protein, partial [Acidobacteriota bacterium]|nr:nucleotidyltransferase family protein [Acidobacteriota bacterium]
AIGHETFSSCIARKMKSAGIDWLCLIAGADFEVIRQKLKGIEVFQNSRYKEGQLSSLKEGLRNLPTGASEVLVWPVDCPLVREETVARLAETYRREHKRITVPIYESRKGHPVIYDRYVIQATLGLNSATHTAKELLTTFQNETSMVEVEDPGILIDIDTPEDYQAHIASAK